MSRARDLATLLLPCLLLGLCLGVGAPAYADDPGPDFPPPTEGAEPAPEDLPVEGPVAEAVPPSADVPVDPEPAAEPMPPANPTPAWSNPAVTPGSGSPLGSLPPPRVLRRRQGTPSAALPSSRPPSRTPPSQAYPTSNAPVRDVPSARAPVAPPVAS
ncbi:MAG: hypothetical protein O2894_08550, partial [Planctomycetota bacterium]|nr:hypothetical protein [Planctomycetota bacterium]